MSQNFVATFEQYHVGLLETIVFGGKMNQRYVSQTVITTYETHRPMTESGTLGITGQALLEYR
jgi:hypothetical protein